MGSRRSLSAARRCSAGRSYWFYEAPSGARSTQVRPARLQSDAATLAGRRSRAQLAATDRPKAVLVNRIRAPEPAARLDARDGGACSATRPTRWSRTSARERPRPSRTPQALLVALRGLAVPGRRAGGLRRGSAPARGTCSSGESSRFARVALSRRAGPRNLALRLSPEAVRRRATGAPAAPPRRWSPRLEQRRASAQAADRERGRRRPTSATAASATATRGARRPQRRAAPGHQARPRAAAPTRGVGERRTGGSGGGGEGDVERPPCRREQERRGDRRRPRSSGIRFSPSPGSSAAAIARRRTRAGRARRRRGGPRPRR